MNLEQTVTKRRRGKELEDAILQAGWDQVLEAGYGGFTIDAVAERAGTSRSVLYRRWENRNTLLAAALAFGLSTTRVTPPDTGSLREDMLELLRRFTRARARLIPLLSVLLGEYFAETGTSIQDLRRDMFGTSTRTAVDDILDRAVARGEADPARLTPRVRAVAVDLLRHDLLVNFRAVPEGDIVAIVDEVFLPLVRPQGA
ncbi:TetR/AcrR family transcriptional regulator [Microbacterium sp. BWT-B31]|uniref:TetR/AcrR family transcriptional regulator n=1 Tax=Microbacterium sp. BWT-B31 TaxID=3232072 RepID=UPI00352851D5